MEIGKITDPKACFKFSHENHFIDLAIIGPEAPLANGVVDALQKINISCVGPKKDLAQIGGQLKALRVNLMRKYNIQGCPNYRIFSNS